MKKKKIRLIGVGTQKGWYHKGIYHENTIQFSTQYRHFIIFLGMKDFLEHYFENFRFPYCINIISFSMKFVWFFTNNFWSLI